VVTSVGFYSSQNFVFTFETLSVFEITVIKDRALRHFLPLEHTDRNGFAMISCSERVPTKPKTMFQTII